MTDTTIDGTRRRVPALNRKLHFYGRYVTSLISTYLVDAKKRPISQRNFEKEPKLVANSNWLINQLAV